MFSKTCSDNPGALIKRTLEYPRPMDKRVEELKEKGMFKETKPDKLGHGTFRMSEVYTEEKLLIENDQVRKDSLEMVKTDLKEAKKYQMELIFTDLKKASAPKKEGDVMVCIKNYKALSKYIEDLVSLYSSKEHTRFLSSLNYALFNIKFHYLTLEGVLMHNTIHNTKKCSVKHFSYFLKEYQELSRIFSQSPLENFIISRPRDLEEVMKQKMRIFKRSPGQSPSETQPQD